MGRARLRAIVSVLSRAKSGLGDHEDRHGRSCRDAEPNRGRVATPMSRRPIFFALSHPHRRVIGPNFASLMAGYTAPLPSPPGSGNHRCIEMRRLFSAPYRWRWAILIVWGAALLLAAPLLPRVSGALKVGGFSSPHTEAARAREVLQRDLGFAPSTMLVVYQSDRWRATDAAFQDALPDHSSRCARCPTSLRSCSRRPIRT